MIKCFFKSLLIFLSLVYIVKLDFAFSQDEVPQIIPPPEDERGANIGKVGLQSLKDTGYFLKQGFTKPYGSCINARLDVPKFCIKKDFFCSEKLLMCIVGFPPFIPPNPIPCIKDYGMEIVLNLVHIYYDLSNIARLGSGVDGTVAQNNPNLWSGNGETSGESLAPSVGGGSFGDSNNSTDSGTKEVKRPLGCFWPPSKYNFPFSAYTTKQYMTQNSRVTDIETHAHMKLLNLTYYGKEFQAFLQLASEDQKQILAGMFPFDPIPFTEGIKNLGDAVSEKERYRVASIPGTEMRAYSSATPLYALRKTVNNSTKYRFFRSHYKIDVPETDSNKKSKTKTLGKLINQNYNSFSLPYINYSESVLGSLNDPELRDVTLKSLQNPRICRDPNNAPVQSIGLGGIFSGGKLAGKNWNRACLNNGLGRFAPITSRCDSNMGSLSDVQCSIIALTRASYLAPKKNPGSFYPFNEQKDKWQMVEGHNISSTKEKCESSFELPKETFGEANIDELRDETFGYLHYSFSRGCGMDAIEIGPGFLGSLGLDNFFSSGEGSTSNEGAGF